MRQQAIGFRELLERVLPLQHLPTIDRFQILRALESGDPGELESVALMAMQRLEDRGALRRLSSVTSGTGQVLRYQPTDSFEIITVELPGPTEREGVWGYDRSRLPSRAPADLLQLRRLLLLD